MTAVLHGLLTLYLRCCAVAHRLGAWVLGRPPGDAYPAARTVPPQSTRLVLSAQGIMLRQEPDPSDQTAISRNRAAYLQGLRTGRTGDTPEELTILARACGVGLRALVPHSRTMQSMWAVTQASDARPGAAVMELVVSSDPQTPAGMLFTRAPGHKKSALKMARLARRGVKWPEGTSLHDYALRLPLFTEISKRAPLPAVEAEPGAAGPALAASRALALPLAYKERCAWPAALHVPLREQFCYAVAEARQWYGAPAVIDVIVRGQSQVALNHAPMLLAVCPQAAKRSPWTEAQLREELLAPLLTHVRALMAQILNQACHHAELDALVALSLRHGTEARRLGADA